MICPDDWPPSAPAWTRRRSLESKTANATRWTTNWWPLEREWWRWCSLGRVNRNAQRALPHLAIDAPTLCLTGARKSTDAGKFHLQAKPRHFVVAIHKRAPVMGHSASRAGDERNGQEVAHYVGRGIAACDSFARVHSRRKGDFMKQHLRECREFKCGKRKIRVWVRGKAKSSRRGEDESRP